MCTATHGGLKIKICSPSDSHERGGGMREEKIRRKRVSVTGHDQWFRGNRLEPIDKGIDVIGVICEKLKKNTSGVSCFGLFYEGSPDIPPALAL